MDKILFFLYVQVAFIFILFLAEILKEIEIDETLFDENQAKFFQSIKSQKTN